MSFHPSELLPAVQKFVKNMDHYPLHFVSHLMHAFEVIGYEHPDEETAEAFLEAYDIMVYALHLNPETVEQHRERMNEDRIAQGRV